MGGGETPAKNGEVLTEDEGAASVDKAVAGDHAVAVVLFLIHPEVRAPMLGEHIILDETICGGKQSKRNFTGKARVSIRR